MFSAPVSGDRALVSGDNNATIDDFWIEASRSSSSPGPLSHTNFSLDAIEIKIEIVAITPITNESPLSLSGHESASFLDSFDKIHLI